MLPLPCLDCGRWVGMFLGGRLVLRSRRGVRCCCGGTESGPVGVEAAGQLGFGECDSYGCAEHFHEEAHSVEAALTFEDAFQSVQRALSYLYAIAGVHAWRVELDVAVGVLSCTQCVDDGFWHGGGAVAESDYAGHSSCGAHWSQRLSAGA